MAVLVVVRFGVKTNRESVMPQLESLPGRIDEALYNATVDATQLVADRYRETINVSPGPGPHTRDTINHDVQRILSGAEGYVGSDSEIAEYLEYGTSPHEIRPIPPNKALRFVVDGRVVFAAVVHHPGTRAYTPLLSATDDMAYPVYRTYEDEIAKIFSDGEA